MKTVTEHILYHPGTLSLCLALWPWLDSPLTFEPWTIGWLPAGHWVGLAIRHPLAAIMTSLWYAYTNRQTNTQDKLGTGVWFHIVLSLGCQHPNQAATTCLNTVTMQQSLSYPLKLLSHLTIWMSDCSVSVSVNLQYLEDSFQIAGPR